MRKNNLLKNNEFNMHTQKWKIDYCRHFRYVSVKINLILLLLSLFILLVLLNIIGENVIWQIKQNISPSRQMIWRFTIPGLFRVAFANSTFLWFFWNTIRTIPLSSGNFTERWSNAIRVVTTRTKFTQN